MGLHGCEKKSDPAAVEKSIIEKITAKQARNRLEREPILLIDVRDADTAKKHSIEKATTIPLSTLQPTMQTAPRNQYYLLIGGDSDSGQLAAETMMKMGFERLTYIEGGYAAWRASGTPDQ